MAGWDGAGTLGKVGRDSERSHRQGIQRPRIPHNEMVRQRDPLGAIAATHVSTQGVT